MLRKSTDFIRNDNGKSADNRPDVLRLGLATVIVVGNSLVVSGDTSLFTYILFLIAASRLYDPLSGAMSNMAELFLYSFR